MSSDPARPLLGAPPATLQDSLQALVGGSVPVEQNSGALDRRYKLDPRMLLLRAARHLRGTPTGGGLLGMAMPASQRAFGLLPDQQEKVVMRDAGDYASTRQARETLMHEFGHVADFRESFPHAARVVDRTVPKKGERAEHYADAFMGAVRFLQDPVSQHPRAAGRLWGTLSEAEQAMARDLLRHPLYGGHPLGAQGLLTVTGEQ